MVHFPHSFAICNNPFFPTGLNYIYHRPEGGIISVLSEYNKSLYSVWDMTYMEEPVLMTLKELQEYLRKESLRSLLTFTKAQLN